MNITGIIAEYNPFHNGHAYQLSKIKESSDAIVVVLSGAFTQRGIPGIFDQHLRAKMALLGGADVVLELPVVFSTGSAEYFAKGAVSLLDKLGCIDTLSFGSESGDITKLSDTARALLNITKEEDLEIKVHISNGLTYPEARAKALKLDNTFLNNPNNILGLEYIKAIYERNSNIKPATITRLGSYLDESLSNNTLSSAMAIRKVLQDDMSVETIRDHVPNSIYELLCEDHINTPVFMDDFTDFLLYKMYLSAKEDLSSFYDVGDFLSNTFLKNMSDFKKFSDFVAICKSKNYTYTRVNRALTHIMLDIRQDFVDDLCKEDYASYARLLGFSSKGEEVLKKIKAHSSIPLISKASKASSMLNGLSLQSFNTDIFASHLYQSIKTKKYGTAFVNELAAPIIKL